MYTVEDFIAALYDELLVRVVQDMVGGYPHSLLEAPGHEANQLLLVVTSVPLTGQDFYWGSYGCRLSRTSRTA